MAAQIKEQLKNIEKKKIERSLDSSIKDGVGYSAMVGFGENYFSSFAVTLKASVGEIAFLSAFSMLLGNAFQMLWSHIADRLRTRKKVIVVSCIVQSLTFLPIMFTPIIFSHKPVIGLIVFVALYQIFGHAVAPAWNSWMGELVPENSRGSYFGRRSRIIGIATFLSFMAGGIILENFSGDRSIIGFIIIFSIALIARFFSVFHLSRMHEPIYKPYPEGKLSLKEFLRRLPYSHFGKFTTYLFILNFAIYIANPFFVVYMYRTLDFTYLQFMIVTAANIIPTFVAMKYWGKYGDRFGNKKILVITGWLIPFNPLLWLLPFGFWYIFLIQIWTGFVWAGFQISSSNFIFDVIEKEKRSKIISYFNFLMGLAIFCGSMIGGFLSKYVFVSPWIFLSNLQILFMISGLIRLFASWRFLRMLREMREVNPVDSERLFIELVAIKPVQKLVAETTIGINTIRDIGEESIRVGKKLIEEGVRMMTPHHTRIQEINELLKDIEEKSRRRKNERRKKA